MATTSARGAREYEPDLYPGQAEGTQTVQRESAEHYQPSTDSYGFQPRRAKRVDEWMEVEFKFGGSRIKRKVVALVLLGGVAVVPMFFIVPAVLTVNYNTFSVAVDDVLGTGAELCLFLCLLVSPLMTITGQRWFFPLRRWYGIMMACCGIGDAAAAGATDNFSGGFFARLTEHTFVLVGTIMVMLVIPLLLTGNNWAQRKLGRYWKTLHKLIYVIWGLLAIHLLTLFGFQPGVQVGAPGDGDTIFHQRFYQYSACSLFLLTLRLPPVKRWIAARQKEGRNWLVYTALTPIFALFVFGMIFIINEEIFKGIDMFNNTPSHQ
jgi:DMSO/TMAO reductase YedYZ heme-binding membrane subunit